MLSLAELLSIFSWPQRKGRACVCAAGVKVRPNQSRFMPPWTVNSILLPVRWLKTM
jgi:hypothetical protein